MQEGSEIPKGQSRKRVSIFKRTRLSIYTSAGQTYCEHDHGYPAFALGGVKLRLDERRHNSGGMQISFHPWPITGALPLWSSWRPAGSPLGSPF